VGSVHTEQQWVEMSQHFVSKWPFSQEVIETLYSHVQVMIGVYSLCTVTGEPLAQTAQSFMPALIQGSNRNFKQARSLLRSLMLIGAVVGLTLGCMAISVPWFFPQLFTKDPAIIHQVETRSDLLSM
jgi:Na+-driven multidrug efflux pump